jgi:hypothetical protein
MASLRRPVSLVFLAVLALALLPGRALAAEREPRDQIVLSGTVEVPRGKEVGEVVVFNGSVTIAGVARGDVVVLVGHIAIFGQVSGSVVNLGGSIVLGPGAQVRGSVIAGDHVITREGAEVGGVSREGVTFSLSHPLGVLGTFIVWGAVAVSTLLLGLVLLLFVPRGVDAVHSAASTAPWTSVGWGVGMFLGLPVLAVLLLASVLGLPLGLVVLLALAFVLFAGYTLSAWIVGRLLWKPPRNRVLSLLIGWAIFTAVAAVPFAGGIVWLLGAMFGLGALVVATWRSRGRRGRHRAGAGPELPPYITEEAMEQEGVGL